MHDCKQYSFVVAVSCAIMLIPSLWFPSWHMYIVIACAFYLAALVAIFLLTTILFVLVWALARFVMKGEN